MTIKIFVNGALFFLFFNDWHLAFYGLFFSCSAVDCLQLHLHFTVLLCVFGNKMGIGIAQMETHGNGNWLHAWEWMGGNWNVKINSRSSQLRMGRSFTPLNCASVISSRRMLYLRKTYCRYCVQKDWESYIIHFSLPTYLWSTAI